MIAGDKKAGLEQIMFLGLSEGAGEDGVKSFFNPAGLIETPNVQISLNELSLHYVLLATIVEDAVDNERRSCPLGEYGRRLSEKGGITVGVLQGRIERVSNRQGRGSGGMRVPREGREAIAVSGGR